jgi:hypothetical protein
MTNRRKFLIGMGSLAASGAAAMGTGAFTTMNAERNASINVVNDANGLITLEPGSGADERVYQSDGELEIGFTSDRGATGVNVNSRYQAGEIRPDHNLPNNVEPVGPQGVIYTNPAFKIMNQDTANKEITLSYELDGSVNEDGSLLHIGFRGPDSSYAAGSTVGSGGPGTLNSWLQVYHGHTNPSYTFDGGAEITPGGMLGAGIFVDTRGSGADTNEDLSGRLRIEAKTP